PHGLNAGPSGAGGIRPDSPPDDDNRIGTVPMSERASTAFLAALLGLAAAIAWPLPGGAQVPEIRLVRQFSMGYLQFNVMDHHRLIEKHAHALGIPEVKVSWLRINGPAAVKE